MGVPLSRIPGDEMAMRRFPHAIPDAADVRRSGSWRDPWFHFGDVCDMLGIDDRQAAWTNLYETSGRLMPFDGPDGEAWLRAVNEHGLYWLLRHAEDAGSVAALLFRDWAFGEVWRPSFDVSTDLDGREVVFLPTPPNGSGHPGRFVVTIEDGVNEIGFLVGAESHGIERSIYEAFMRRLGAAGKRIVEVDFDEDSLEYVHLHDGRPSYRWHHDPEPEDGSDIPDDDEYELEMWEARIEARHGRAADGLG